MTKEASGIDPSATITNLPAQSETLQQVAGEVLPTFGLDQETGAAAFHDFAAQRVEQLSAEDPKKPIGAAYGGTDQFISPETGMILSGLFDKPYHLDDPRVYDVAFPRVREFYNKFQGKVSDEKAYVTAVIHGANYAQAEYFGSVVGDAANRGLVTADNVSDEGIDQEDASIADFKQSAQCQERAGIVHNTLHMFGVKSELITGDLASEQQNGTHASEPHAFLVIDGSEGQQYIFDPTNPIIVRDESGKITSFKPALYPLDLDQQGQQRVEFTEFTDIDGQKQPAKTQTLTYSFARHQIAA